MSGRAGPGDLYVSDAGSGDIFKFTPARAKSTFASALNKPRGLAFDRDGNLFVGDSGSGTILKFAPDGSKSTFASGITAIQGLAFDGMGNLFVAAEEITQNGPDFDVILKFAPGGTQSTFASSELLDDSEFLGLAFDSASNLFVAQYGPSGPNAIVKFTPAGTRSTFAGPITVAGLAFDASGNLFATDFKNGHLLVFTASGTSGPIASGLVDFPFGVALDTSGNVFVANVSGGTIFKFTPAGTKSTFASGLNQPAYIAFEPVTEKLRNLSARGVVRTGQNVLIGGFIVGGNAVATNAVVIRAIGPSLSQFGIANPLQDPTLELHNATGAVIASNDNWEESQSMQITASGLAPPDPHESAIFATLPAGNFTAVVRGVGETSGVALLEVYSLQ